MTTFTCDDALELAPDLALGQLSGNDRGAMIDHLAGCASCRRHLESMVRVVDELLLLAPSIEPSIGFESRVMARLTADGALTPLSERAHREPWVRHWITGQSRTRARLPVLAAVAAALLIVASLVALHRSQNAGQGGVAQAGARATTQLAARTVVVWADGGRSACQLVAFPRVANGPARLVVHLDEPGLRPDSYQVLAIPVDHGPPVPIGTIQLTDGQGTLAAAVPLNAGPVDAVRVLDGNGTTRYSATFAAV